MTTRITAPMLDDVLGRLRPETVAALQALPPAGYTDQVEAARNQAVALMEYTEEDHVGSMPHGEVDEWIRLGVLDTFITWFDGRARTCMHGPDHRRPEPAWSCAWRPGLVVCTYCLYLLDVVGDADKICDGCGHVCAGVEAGDPIWTGCVWLGELAFQFGTCRDCRPAAAPPERTTA